MLHSDLLKYLNIIFFILISGEFPVCWTAFNKLEQNAETICHMPSFRHFTTTLKMLHSKFVQNLLCNICTFVNDDKEKCLKIEDCFCFNQYFN